MPAAGWGRGGARDALADHPRPPRRGWYAYQSNSDATTGHDAGFSPRHRLFASLQYAWGKAFFNLQGTDVGDRARVAEDPRDEPQEYGQIGLLAGYQLTKRLSLQLDVRNLLNNNIQEAAPGTSLPVDLRLPRRNDSFALERAFEAGPMPRSAPVWGTRTRASDADRRAALEASRWDGASRCAWGTLCDPFH
jgi:hypothetical protein